MSTLWQSSNCFKTWHWTMTVGDLQQERVLEGWAAIRNCPNVSQKAAPGHLFILLFARRQCSRLWRRNPIFILSFNVFFSPSHYPTLSPKLFSAAIVPSNLLFPLFFLTLLLSLPLSPSFSPLCQSHQQTHIHMHKHKRFFSILLASGTAVWLNTV